MLTAWIWAVFGKQKWELPPRMSGIFPFLGLNNTLLVRWSPMQWIVPQNFKQDGQSASPWCVPLLLRWLLLPVSYAVWGRGACLGGAVLCCPHPPCSSPVPSHRIAACSTPRGSASPVFRRISVLSLRKSGRMWRREKVPPRGLPTIPDCHAHSLLLCSAGLVQPGFPLGAVYLAFSELWSTWSPGNRGGGQDSGSGSSCSSRIGL